MATLQTQTYVLRNYDSRRTNVNVTNVNVFHKFFSVYVGSARFMSSWCTEHMLVLFAREFCLLIHILVIRHHMQNVAY